MFTAAMEARLAGDEEDEVELNDLIKGMEEAQRRSRGYATFWEWPLDRQLAERGVVNALASYLTHSEGGRWDAIESVEHDPPDVLLRSSEGKRIGVEVTELVDPDAIKDRNQSGKTGSHEWANWSVEDVSTKLRQIVLNKDRKLANNAKSYDSVYLVIFTDEPIIDADLTRQAVMMSSIDVQNIDRAFFVLSYDPRQDVSIYPNGHPVFAIPLLYVRSD